MVAAEAAEAPSAANPKAEPEQLGVGAEGTDGVDIGTASCSPSQTMEVDASAHSSADSPGPAPMPVDP